MSAGRLLALALAAGLCGCPKGAAPPNESDPLIQKLKAEQLRLAQQQAAAQASPLAQAAVADAPTRQLTPLASRAQLGPVALGPRALEVSHRVKDEHLALSTADLFVRVSLDARASQRATLDLGAATLRQGDQSFAVARDAQRVGQGSPLTATLEPEVDQTLVLYFEAPEAAVRKGLTLVLRFGESAVELPLQ